MIEISPKTTPATTKTPRNKSINVVIAASQTLIGRNHRSQDVQVGMFVLRSAADSCSRSAAESDRCCCSDGC
jgi:hypothetical protein